MDLSLLTLVGERGSARYRLAPALVEREARVSEETQGAVIIHYTRRHAEIRNADVRLLLGGLDVREARETFSASFARADCGRWARSAAPATCCPSHLIREAAPRLS